MSIKKLLKEVLSLQEILDLTGDKKVYFLHALKPTTPYIEYEVINEYGAYHDENGEKYTTYLVQVDIFDIGDYTALEEEIKKVMIKSGFTRGEAVDLFEKDTKLNHKAMRFSIELNVSE